MKKLTMILAFMLLATITTKATVWSVNNNPANNSAADYTILQHAIDSASAGDTIYIYGSPINYGSVYVKKQLYFFGEGYNVIGAGRYSTKVTTFYLSEIRDALNQLVSNASGSVFTGFQCIIESIRPGISNITILRNRVWVTYNGSSSAPASNWIIINNLLGKLYYYNNSNYKYNNNFQIENNIVNKGIPFNCKNATIKNNLFIGSSIIVYYGTVTNNIFYYAKPGGFYNSVLKNNLSYANGSTKPTNFDYGTTNLDTNNIEAQNPKFTSVTISSTPSFDYAHDYHLQPTSPAIGAGINGVDIGIYGGNYPFPSGGDVPLQTSPLPGIPQILNLQISNTLIPIDSVLHINLNARVRN
jgi:hypothetical protein